ncbi:uncharacterized protein LOC132295592 [Cornus florida]|uniref:uncharacterized protein LOC132295592 n=1 Tax=Cornus florida TaxID=4283 RepID=UPI00289928FA|nr:uncharacterized protein LOC132295592 [Cornus florida]
MPIRSPSLEIKTSSCRFSDVQPTSWQKRWFELCARWSSSTELVDYSGLAAFICWFVWKSGNALLFNKSARDPFQVAQTTSIDFYEFKEIFRQNSLFSIPSQPSYPISEVWTAPLEGLLKLNINVSFNSLSLTCGGGLVLRNHLGRPIKIVSIFFHSVGYPALAEGLVLKASLCLLKDWGYHHAIVEGDCQTMQRLQPSVESLFVVMDDISSLLSDYPNLSLAWTPIICNVVAHLVSKKALEAGCGDLEWNI